MEAVVEGTLARWFTEPFRRSHPAAMERVAGYIRRTPVAGYVGSCQAIPKIDLTARLQEITCPALIIVGEQDAGTPVALAKDIHAAMPGSELVIIPSASHLSNIEQPRAFESAMLSFLERVSGQPR
jgi:3-oxoadipate enol-lactonase